jgi:hypothetical protein
VTSSGAWEAISITGPDSALRQSSAGPSQSDDPEAAALGALSEEQYYAQLFRDYVAAKQSVGEDASGIPEERFVERMKGNAVHLAKKHGSRTVRFKVETIGGQVNLRPVVIR